MLHKCYSKLNKSLTFTILDFERPDISYALLKSIRNRVFLPNYEVIFYSNGGRQDYIGQFYREGLIDKCILSKQNEGSGFATIRMVEFVQTEFFFNFQCDSIIREDLTIEDFDKMKEILSNPEVGAIDFTFLKDFSERAYMMRTDFYCANTFHEGGGAGPYFQIGLNTEQTTGAWIAQNKKEIYHWPEQLVGDLGKYAISEYPCGGQINRRCDTQQIWITKPFKQKYSNLYGFTNAEWELILAGKWLGGTIPEVSKNKSFFFFSNELDPIDN